VLKPAEAGDASCGCDGQQRNDPAANEHHHCRERRSQRRMAGAASIGRALTPGENYGDYLTV